MSRIPELCVVSDPAQASLVDQSFGSPQEMTVADFVKARFAPEHVAAKSVAGRKHYQAILKHILTPPEVEAIFGLTGENPKAKLRPLPGWPYMSNVRLSEAEAGHVHRLVDSALQRGYSTQMAKHIRNAVSVIFSFAIKEQVFNGRNPASLVALPEMTRKEAHALSLEQAVRVLSVMQYPEKELSLMAILTEMNMAEICGLQWKHVNISTQVLNREGQTIPGRSIAVRKQWNRGELSDVPKGRRKTVPISPLLHSILVALGQQSSYVGWNDFVLVSKAGTPINQVNVAARRLKLIGEELGMPWLSWQVFRRTHSRLVDEFGAQLHRHISMALKTATRPIAAP